MNTLKMMIEIPSLESPLIENALDVLGSIGVTFNDILNDLLTSVFNGDYKSIEDIIDNNSMEAVIANIYECNVEDQSLILRGINNTEDWVLNGVHYIQAQEAVDFILVTIAPSIFSIINNLPIRSAHCIVHQANIVERLGPNRFIVELHVGENIRFLPMGTGTTVEQTNVFRTWCEGLDEPIHTHKPIADSLEMGVTTPISDITIDFS